MTQKNFYMTVGVVFLIIALLHLGRIINGWNAIIGEVSIPVWVSWAAVIVAGYLSYTSFNLQKKFS